MKSSYKFQYFRCCNYSNPLSLRSLTPPTLGRCRINERQNELTNHSVPHLRSWTWGITIGNRIHWKRPIRQRSTWGAVNGGHVEKLSFVLVYLKEHNFSVYLNGSLTRRYDLCSLIIIKQTVTSKGFCVCFYPYNHINKTTFFFFTILYDVCRTFDMLTRALGMLL